MTDEKPKRSDNKGAEFHRKEQKESLLALLKNLRWGRVPEGARLKTAKEPSRDDLRKAAIAARPSQRQIDRARLATRLALALEEREQKLARKADPKGPKPR